MMKNVEDQRLERRVALALLTVRLPRFSFQHIHVDRRQVVRLAHAGTREVELHAREGTVTLAGNVPHATEKATLELLVRRVPGVVNVIDNLQVVALRRT